MPAELLVCDLRHRRPLAYVTVRGRLDLHTAPGLRRTVLKALAAEPRAVLVDLGGVSAVDPVALTVFLALSRAAAAWPGAQLINHSAGPSLARELDGLAIGRHAPLTAGLAEAEALAARRAGPVRVSWDVAGGAGGLAEARAVVRAFCARHGREAVSANAELVVTELAVNAFLHGAAPVTAWVSARDRYLHLAVQDRSPAVPRLTGPTGPIAAGGRGLLIVEALTVAWGATAIPAGKIVWATLRP
ncbi:STAS domain-containing protein [Dactylosporangium sp. NPDC005555]|uniref:STAS domain-containing protein n=1 Tax=Dactylosporangium sp. NPDC005555 TaxID=3154889 RepID=UPI0033ADB75F